MLEDMYWIDGRTGEVVASALDEKSNGTVAYSDSINKAIQGKSNLIAMHTHPHSMPPSIADFNSAYVHGYYWGLVLCHDGTIYLYYSNQRVPDRLHEIYIKEFLEKGFPENEAQLKGLDEIRKNYDIVFWEVK